MRRIEAVAGPAVLEYLNVRDKVVRELSDYFKVKPEELPERVTSVQNELRTTQKQLETLKAELALAKSEALFSQAETVGNYKILVAQMGDVDPESLKTAAERLLQKNWAMVLWYWVQFQKLKKLAWQQLLVRM